MIYGYIRVSTGKQTKNNSFEEQEKEILNKYPTAIIFRESFSGTKIDRPVLNSILEKLKTNDILITTKLDRLARNTVEGIKLVQDLFDINVSIHILNVGFLENTSTGKFFWEWTKAFSNKVNKRKR